MSGLRGTVTKIVGTSSYVQADEGLYRCDLRARLFRKEKVRLAVGDEVTLTSTDEEVDVDGLRRGVIEALSERRGCLRRTRDFKRDQIVCANVDQIFLVMAAFDPPYKRSFIDRVLVGASRDQLRAVLVINKIDLAEDPEYRALVGEDAGVYEALGYLTLLVSATTGEGIDQLKAAFVGKVSAVVGPSGVGKSTLLNTIQPGLRLRTGEVSSQDGRGRHTTTAAELLRLEGGGFVVDTPGLRGFGLWDVTPEEVTVGFPEVEALAPSCRFSDCAHKTEPSCAVRSAVESGEVDEERYESFLKLREDSEAQAAQRQSSRRR